jgi:opacity protein-like surface antigen
VGVLAVLLAPLPAKADGLIIPFVGVNFAGDSGKEISTALDSKRFNWGASIAYMGGGVFGLEGDVGYSPDFFGKSDIGGSSVQTVTGNLLFGIPFGGQKGLGVRPYALVGVGVIRSDVKVIGDLFTFEHTEPAWDFGGGVMLFLGSNVGLRADVRYFRTFGGVDFGLLDLIDGSRNIDFARASAGMVLRF